ncbi:electron transport complex subunit RsxG [Alteromonas halophila]|uniref:Ion-translocating oxidoreductase complex subunit G n=1 Tax=Alteromonas halophila TaxID=516698 RepID=A0A918JDY4_9ALTE|nr:electron transport complex subunit RsxG [Alteromonas halophila]GGW74325.1 electron transport complex subunit G [Alteromonas halophila]
MLSAIARNGVMLALFAIVTTALISLTFSSTRDRIRDQQQQRLLAVLGEVIPPALHDNLLYQNCTQITDPRLGSAQPHRVYRAYQGQQPVALAVETTAPDGYSGNIELVVGISMAMDVLGVRVIEHKETPGLGDKIETSVSDWIYRFSGMTFNPDKLSKWQVKKDGGVFDQFTGATITPRAVVSAVKNTLILVEQERTQLLKANNLCAPDKGEAS